MEFSLLSHTNYSPEPSEKGSAEEHLARVIIIMFQEKVSRAVALKAQLQHGTHL
jgi:hypothetical protein